jgi:hypothetical protein
MSSINDHNLALEKQVKTDFEEYTKPVKDIQLTNRTMKDEIKARCGWCWQDRIITTNGKCRVCGAVLVSQKHWKPTIAKIKLINKHSRNKIPLEINKRLYMVPEQYFRVFKDTEHLGFKANVELVEEIRKTCKSFKIIRE